MIRLSFLLALLLTTCATFAQSNFTGWVALNNLYRFPNSKFGMHLDVQFRGTSQITHLNSAIFRPGLNWHFHKDMFATVGYAFIEHRRIASGVAGYAPEHRIWQQLIINQPVSFFTLQHRFRLEERFIVRHRLENGDFKTGGNYYATRFRYFGRAVIPLDGAKPFTKGLFGAVQNEVFLNLGDNSSVNGKSFDQNRLYLAIGYRLRKEFDLEVGYMNQYISGVNKAFVNNHILQLATYLRL
ncbi:MAG: DUF2490 domain-containing protein [Chitinophagaceae bacterium]|nr:MAG: DUF2490 domain-containing protein [Chitinophagaceae bacterium]